MLELQFHAQRRGYADQFPEAEQSIVLLDGEPVGQVWIDRREDELRLVDIALVPERRRDGIGTEVVGGLLAEADGAGVPVRLTVALTNGPSLRFFDRLGFARTASDGIHASLERPAPFARLRELVLADPALEERLQAPSDWPSFEPLALAVAAEHGVPVTDGALERERRAARQRWLERWI